MLLPCWRSKPLKPGSCYGDSTALMFIATLEWIVQGKKNCMCSKQVKGAFLSVFTSRWVIVCDISEGDESDSVSIASSSPTVTVTLIHVRLKKPASSLQRAYHTDGPTRSDSWSLFCSRVNCFLSRLYISHISLLLEFLPKIKRILH